ncbi:hypothetical protein PCE1_003987 [Barthelona sp. PCE]
MLGVPGSNSDGEQTLYPEMLFNITRFRRPISFSHLIWLLWIPFGFCLMVIRILLLLLSSAILFRLSALLHFEDQFFRIFALFMGFVIKVDDPTGLMRNHTCPVIVANHTSEFDSVAIRVLFGNRMSIIAPKFYKKSMLTRSFVHLLNPLYTEIKKERRYILQQKIKKHVNELGDEKPLILFPEGCLSNGKHCLLQYQKFCFSLEKKVLVLALRFNNPFHKVLNLDHLTASVLSNILWMFSCPYNVIEAHPIEEAAIEEGETPIDFAARCQEVTARHLGLDPSMLSKKDKYKLVKKYFAIRNVKYDSDALGFKFGLGLQSYDNAIDKHSRRVHRREARRERRAERRRERRERGENSEPRVRRRRVPRTPRTPRRPMRRRAVSTVKRGFRFVGHGVAGTLLRSKNKQE